MAKKLKTLIELRYELVLAAQAKLISITFEDQSLSIKFINFSDPGIKTKVKKLEKYIKETFDGISDSYIHSYQEQKDSIIQYELVIVHIPTRAFNTWFEL
jgi:hypothetical protein